MGKMLKSESSPKIVEDSSNRVIDELLGGNDFVEVKEDSEKLSAQARRV